MSESLSALLYLVASICFIMALRGLSSPETARAGNIYGIVGMVIAILTTLASPEVVSYWLIALGIVIGGTVGAYIARQIQMSSWPLSTASSASLRSASRRRRLPRRRLMGLASAARSIRPASSRWRSG